MSRIAWIAIFLLLLPCAALAQDVEVTVVPDAWPKRPRSIGYEYNQKNHNSPPRFVDRSKTGADLKVLTPKDKRYRVVSVRFENRAETKVGLRVEVGGFRKGKKLPLELGPRELVVRTYPIREPKDGRFVVRVYGKQGSAPILTREVELPKDGRVTGWPGEAYLIAQELRNEDAERRRVQLRGVEVTLRDDLDRPVPGARLVLLQAKGLMVAEGRTGPEGKWRGRVLPGAHHVFAFAEVPDRKVHEDNKTTVRTIPRLVVLQGELGAEASSVTLRPEREVTLRARDADGARVRIDRLWITPGPLAPSYAFSRVAQQVGGRARLESSRTIPRGEVLVLTSAKATLHTAALSNLSQGTSLFLRAKVEPEVATTDLVFDPASVGRLILDPATGVGLGRSASLSLVAADGLRESLRLDTQNLHTLYVHPGSYRLDVGYTLFDNGQLDLLPYAASVAAGETLDLTPRAPFTATLYSKNKGAKVQFWLALQDATGRVIRRPPRGGTLLGALNGRTVLERDLSALRWEQQISQELNLANCTFQVEVPCGYDTQRLTPTAKLLTTYNAEGASGRAPDVLGPRMQAMLPEVKRALDGTLRFLGLPEGLRRIHMEFDVFMPPGVGGTGGGGTITLDIPNLYRFTAGSDPLPGAFRHELGHNLGFGHDPYMLLADPPVDEQRYGAFGYRMLHARTFQKTLDYLGGQRHAEAGPWRPGRGPYNALRLLFGPEVHKEMLAQRRAHETTLGLYDLSSIERIATLYSLAVDRNVAWVFRAHGWPVFDHRVDLGIRAARSKTKHPPRLNVNRIEGTPLNAWWVYGPTTPGRAADGGWRHVRWPGRAIFVDEDRDPEDGEQQSLFFREVISSKAQMAKLLVASDVQLRVRLNGAAVADLDASPQLSQPVHDELMLDQKRSIWILLQKGENVFEVATRQLRGSKGFLIELITLKGKPLPIKLSRKGPLGEPDARPVKLEARDPVYNGSFELGGALARAWTRGAVEGPLKFRTARDEKLPHGKKALRCQISGSGRGGWIQRVMVEPKKKYRLSAAIKTEGLVGEAYVCFFTGDINDGQREKTAPVRDGTAGWKRFSADRFSGNSRVVYVACYVRGSAGVVWFDAVTLEKL